MATYKKKLKTLAVHLMLDSEVVNIADTATDDMATRALNEFKAYETMHYETTEGSDKITNAIPYHAVQYIEVTETKADITKADPYGCEGGVSDTVTIRFEGTDVFSLETCSGEEEITEEVAIPKGSKLTTYSVGTVEEGGVRDAHFEGSDGVRYEICTEYVFNENVTLTASGTYVPD